jgi:hypothetical protein
MCLEEGALAALDRLKRALERLPDVTAADGCRQTADP